jgi:ferric-dicitrate binding protein FerR (iron transport regulator)
MDDNKAKRLAIAIIKIKLRKASPGEQEMLLAWLDEREDNRRLYKRIVRGEALGDRFRGEDQFLRSADLDRVMESIIRKLTRRRRARVLGRVWRSAAAACLAGLLVASYLLVEPSAPAAPGEVQVSSFKASLILPSGERVNLGEEFPRELTLATTRISNDVDGLSLHEQEAAGEPAVAEMCRVITSAGGQYHVLLQDGTEIWLNTTSELEFPSVFSSGRRLVRLSGEAFFKVSPGAPFIVEAGGVETTVRGTSFNVHAYEEDETVAVTLLTGRVEVSATGNTVALAPGMAATWRKATGALESEEVRAENAVSWRVGLFTFTNEKLEQVTRALARWHGVRFVYSEPSVKDHLFTGRVSMEEEIANVLESITIAGGPRFHVAGEVVYVSK